MPHRTRRANKRNRRKWRDDALVPISGERMRAALQHSGVTLPELVRRLGDRRQTLDYIVRGKTDRCRRSRRTAIAKALGVPAEWLGGGPEGGMDWLFAQLAGRPQSQLAINRLGRRCEAALQRDGSPVPDATGDLLMLALLSHWRGVLFEELPPELLECEDLPGPERDIAETALANAFETALRPWFTGQGKLDYRALHAYFGSTR